MKKETKADFYQIINPILQSEEFRKRKKYNHHEDSVYEHCLQVAKLTFKISRSLNLDYESATIGALLHDFYPADWQKNKKKKSFFKLHGFVHAYQAKKEAQKHYGALLNPKVENIIERHMFPLTIKPPIYLESWLVMLVDKGVSLSIFKKPTKLPKYIGLKEVKVNGKNNSWHLYRSRRWGD